MKRLTSQLIFRFKSFNLGSIAAMITRNSGLSVTGIILRLIPVMRGRLTPGVVKGIKITLSRISKIANSQGIPGLVKYLKANSVLLQQCLAGYKVNDFSPRVSRTNRGFPRLLPVSFRKLMYKGNTFYMQLSLTIFSIFRDMVYPSPPKLNSITDPFKGNQAFLDEIIKFIPSFKKCFCPTSSRFDLRNKFSFFPIDKSSPQSISGLTSTHPMVLVKSALAFTPEMVQALTVLSYLSTKDQTAFKPRGNWIENLPQVMYLIEWIRHDRDQWIWFLNLANKVWNPDKILSNLRRYPKFEVTRNIVPRHDFVGKLGLKQEAAGKMRVFAMVDPWTQMILRPFHKCIFDILRKHPMDGTFDQLRPLNKAWRFSQLYSMDLSSATDRLPMSLQVPLLKSVFNLTDKEAEAWRYALVGRSYLVPNTGGLSVTYTVGQPMGALSSWAMLALTHHFIVQVASWKAGVVPQGTLYRDYAVLGDDIVIFNKKVAMCYHNIITGIGVECNLAKSIMSHKGLGLEFAKKTFYKGVNISPCPLKELFAALQDPVSLIQYGRQHSLNLVQLLSAAGFGYRVKSRCSLPFWKIGNFKVKALIMISIFQAGTAGERISLFTRYFKSPLHIDLIKNSILEWLNQTITEVESTYDHSLRRLRSAFLIVNFEDRMLGFLARNQGLPLRQNYHELINNINHKSVDRGKDLIRRFLAQLQEMRTRLSVLPPDPVLSLNIMSLEIKRFLLLERQVAALPKDIKGLKSKLWYKGSDPKVFKVLDSWKAVFQSLVKPIARKDLPSVSQVDQSLTFRESGFFSVRLLGRIVRAIFLTAQTTSSVNDARRNTILHFLSRPNFLRGFSLRTLFWFLAGESIIVGAMYAIIFLIIWLILHYGEPGVTLSSLVPLALTFYTGSIIPVLEHFMMFWASPAVVSQFPIWLYGLFTFIGVHLNTLYWSANDIISSLAVINPLGFSQWIGFIWGIGYYYVFRPSFKLILLPFLWFTSYQEWLLDSPLIDSIKHIYDVFVCTLVEDYWYLRTGISPNNVISVDVSLPDWTSSEQDYVDPWQINDPVLNSSASPDSDETARYSDFFKRIPESEPETFDEWCMVNTEPDSVRVRIRNLIINHYIISTSAVTWAGYGMVRFLAWYCSSSTSILG